MDLCNGEIAAVAVTKISAPIGAGATYNSQCTTCARWAGPGATTASDMQDFVIVQFIASDRELRPCVNRKENTCTT